MPTTPEPRSVRARTPPTPLHGPQYEQYEPYSPRRSTRSTAQSNPYSSLNSERSPKANPDRNITPPPTAKRARFTRMTTHLSSPPSSPASPARLHRSPQQHHKTPRKLPSGSRIAPANGALSDSDHAASSSLAPHNIDPATMLPTPSKTPRKRNAAALNSTARILSFQPNNPNDVMPSSRKMKKHGRFNSMNGFDLYDEERASSGAQIEIFTDANARVPEMDEADDNPFIGSKKSAPRPQRRSRRALPTTAEDEMDEAARRDEGVVYVFRGKKIFRRFSDPEEERASSAGTDTSDVPGQRTLKRQAGAAAQRPLTRSSIKPRLLFRSSDQLLEREPGPDDVDEEAVTDIEMDNASSSPVKAQTGKAAHNNNDQQTPARVHFKPTTPPPSTTRATRSAGKKASPLLQLTPVYEDEPEPMSVGTDETFPAQAKGKGKGHSPFDAWQRTKAGRKRAGEPAEGASVGKRTRSAGLESPA